MKKKKKKKKKQPLACKKQKEQKLSINQLKKKKLYKLKSNNNTSMPTLKSTFMRYYQCQLLKVDVDSCLSALTLGLTSMLFLKLKILKKKKKSHQTS
jgi:hypothetical protein